MKILIIIILLAVVARFGRGRYVNKWVKRPNMKTTKQREWVELKEIEPHIRASVIVPWPKDNASNIGFRILAWYIFWWNTKKESISMTAPVITQKTQQDSSEKIAMTAPVITEQQENDSYIVTFVMPKEYTLDSLPIPKDNRISFEQTEAEQFYVRTFGWYANESRANKQLELFKQELQTNWLSTSGQFSLAQYNDPRTPPMMRTNEWWVRVGK